MPCAGRSRKAAWNGKPISLSAFHRLSRQTKIDPANPDAISEDWSKEHAAFHTALVSACGSPTLMSIRARLFEQADRYVALSIMSSGPLRDDVTEHKQLMRAALNREIDKMIELNRLHITKTLDRRKEYGGLEIDQAKRMKDLERENVRLKRLVADLSLEKQVLIRSDNGAEMTAKVVRNWLTQVGAKTLFIERGSPWENGYCESFNGKLRDELLNGEIFYSLKEAKIVIEQWRKHYNTIRPHSSLGYRPPAPQTMNPFLTPLDQAMQMQ